MHFTLHNNIQWRIQDYLPPQVGSPITWSKLHDDERNWTQGAVHPWHPVGSANDICARTISVLYVHCDTFSRNDSYMCHSLWILFEAHSHDATATETKPFLIGTLSFIYVEGIFENSLPITFSELPTRFSSLLHPY